MRSFALFFLLGVAAISAAGAPVPPELDAALKRFRSEGSPGWAFTQTTEAGGKSLVERFDPSKPDFSRWTLLRKDGREPTAAEAQEYGERLSRRTSGTAPNVKDQLDLSTCELQQEDATRASYRFGLKPGEKGDRSAAHMRAVFVLNKATQTIERVELASFEPFSPVFAVRIAEAQTVMYYTLPTADRPTLLDRVTVRIRGRAMLVKSLDEDMTVTYSDHERTQRDRRTRQP